jgi:hypothetical protein
MLEPNGIVLYFEICVQEVVLPELIHMVIVE